MDRFLSVSLSLSVSLYCLSAGCILIASKLTECDVVPAETLCAAAEYGFQPSDLRVGLCVHRTTTPGGGWGGGGCLFHLWAPKQEPDLTLILKNLGCSDSHNNLTTLEQIVKLRNCKQNLKRVILNLFFVSYCETSFFRLSTVCKRSGPEESSCWTRGSES